MFATAMFAEVISGRTHLLLKLRKIPDQSRAVERLIRTLAGVSFFALIIWGLAIFPWYFALIIIVAAGIIGAVIVEATFSFWLRTRTFVELIAVLMTTFLWLSYWPS
jgi:hypothetical protein